ncbi:hypothetical protein [Vibrio cholerae]|uniref:hypothetical protein n=1 Tax=Vibrio cholerae TaxID=666 RepID=UPI001C30D2A2
MNPLTYQARPCKYTHTYEQRGLSCKSYLVWSEMYSKGELPDISRLDSLINASLDNWDHPNDHAAAFAITHLANDGWYFLISRWNDANMLRHRVFSVNSNTEQWALSPLSDSSIIACIWEFKLMMKERDFWVDEVLEAPCEVHESRRISNYLSKCFEGNL